MSNLFEDVKAPGEALYIEEFFTNKLCLRRYKEEEREDSRRDFNRLRRRRCRTAIFYEAESTPSSSQRVAASQAQPGHAKLATS